MFSGYNQLQHTCLLTVNTLSNVSAILKNTNENTFPQSLPVLFPITQSVFKWSQLNPFMMLTFIGIKT
jgi:hypothetical protein